MSRIKYLFLLVCMSCSPSFAFDIIIPAYANPCCGNGPEVWSKLLQTATTNNEVRLHVVFNPASGPGTAVDPNYVAPDGSGPLTDLNSTSAVIYGYVSTVYAARDIAVVKDEIDRYVDTLYPGVLDGVFFDEMSTDLANAGYYRELSDYVKSKLPGALTIGNAGVSGTTNPGSQTQYTLADYADSVDTIVTFENFASEYDSEPDPAWLATKGTSHFANLIHSTGAWDAQIVSTAVARKVGLLYVTDDTLGDPWDSITSWWPELVAAAVALNDSDSDTIPDNADNCTLVGNFDQRDTDGDGFGNICDADLSNDGVINFVDLGLLKSVFFSADADADFDGNGAVNFTDLAVLKASFFGAPGPSGTVAPTYWTPPASASWWWQIENTGQLDLTHPVDVYDIDLFEGVDTGAITALNNAGKRVVCYYSAGTYEPFRPDQALFTPESVISDSALPQFDEELWLAIGDPVALELVIKPILRTRMDLAASAGCDAVEPDNVDGFQNDETQGEITAADQLAFNLWLADEAHARGLGVGLKNDLSQIPALLDSFDFAVNEQCFAFGNECTEYESTFLAVGKPVFNQEYGDNSDGGGMSQSEFENVACPYFLSQGISALWKETLALDGNGVVRCVP